jgi:hypothetical protein
VRRHTDGGGKRVRATDSDPTYPHVLQRARNTLRNVEDAKVISQLSLLLKQDVYHLLTRLPHILFRLPFVKLAQNRIGLALTEHLADPAGGAKLEKRLKKHFPNVGVAFSLLGKAAKPGASEYQRQGARHFEKKNTL